MKRRIRMDKVSIKWNGEDAEVTLKRFTAGERNDIQDKAVNFRIFNGVMQGNLSIKTLREETVLKGIVSAPFKHDTIEDIRKLPPETFDKIFEKLNEINNVSIEKKEK